MDYKSVKNPSKPGRPPSGCVWVKDEAGNLVTNDKGEVAYRKATAADKAKKKPAKKARGRKKTAARGRGRKAVSLGDDQKAAQLLKKTYKDLAADELAKIRGICDSLIESAKESERKQLEKQIGKLQNKLEKLA